MLFFFFCLLFGLLVRTSDVVVLQFYVLSCQPCLLSVKESGTCKALGCDSPLESTIITFVHEGSKISGITKNRRILVYTFCLINIRLSLSDDANKTKTLNIERA